MSNLQRTIWVDADACPKVVKEVIYKFSALFKTPACFVVNSHLNIPLSPFLSFVQVEQGDDVADQYIAQRVQGQDLVITADIPLAHQVVHAGVLAINPRGELYDKENVGEKLSMRDFMKDLRDSGLVTGGPDSFSDKDKINFTNTLNKLLSQKS